MYCEGEMTQPNAYRPLYMEYITVGHIRNMPGQHEIGKRYKFK